MPPTVLLVDDHLAYRESLRLALTSDGAFTIVGEAGRAHDVPPLVRQTRPDLVVLDFVLPDGNGISIASELKRLRLRVPTLILGRMFHPVLVREAFAAGVGGLAHKHESLAVVRNAMERVANGETYLSPMLQRRLQRSEPDSATALTQLSAREREVLFLLLDGHSTKHIATSLFLSPKTVDAHRLHINRKLGVRSPASLARLVASQGLLLG
jgi:DNA-binding NarL/FixJ family response regulator